MTECFRFPDATHNPLAWRPCLDTPASAPASTSDPGNAGTDKSMFVWNPMVRDHVATANMCRLFHVDAASWTPPVQQEDEKTSTKKRVQLRVPHSVADRGDARHSKSVHGGGGGGRLSMIADVHLHNPTFFKKFSTVKQMRTELNTRHGHQLTEQQQLTMAEANRQRKATLKEHLGGLRIINKDTPALSLIRSKDDESGQRIMKDFQIAVHPDTGALHAVLGCTRIDMDDWATTLLQPTTTVDPSPLSWRNARVPDVPFHAKVQPMRPPKGLPSLQLWNVRATQLVVTIPSYAPEEVPYAVGDVLRTTCSRVLEKTWEDVATLVPVDFLVRVKPSTRQIAWVVDVDSPKSAVSLAAKLFTFKHTYVVASVHGQTSNVRPISHFGLMTPCKLKKHFRTMHHHVEDVRKFVLCNVNLMAELHARVQHVANKKYGLRESIGALFLQNSGWVHRFEHHARFEGSQERSVPRWTVLAVLAVLFTQDRLKTTDEAQIKAALQGLPKPLRDYTTCANIAMSRDDKTPIPENFAFPTRIMRRDVTASVATRMNNALYLLLNKASSQRANQADTVVERAARKTLHYFALYGLVFNQQQVHQPRGCKKGATHKAAKRKTKPKTKTKRSTGKRGVQTGQPTTIKISATPQTAAEAAAQAAVQAAAFHVSAVPNGSTVSHMSFNPLVTSTPPAARARGTTHMVKTEPTQTFASAAAAAAAQFAASAPPLHASTTCDTFTTSTVQTVDDVLGLAPNVQQMETGTSSSSSSSPQCLNDLPYLHSDGDLDAFEKELMLEYTDPLDLFSSSLDALAEDADDQHDGSEKESVV